MPTWLSENNPSLYFLLAAVVAICAAAWWRTRQRKYAVAAGVALALLGGAVACHKLVESDFEQMARKMNEIGDAIRARNVDQAFRHVDESFRRGAFDKRAFQDFAAQRLRMRQVESFAAWDYELGPTSHETRRAELTFSFVVHGSFGQTPPGFFAKTTWAMDANGEWRLQHFDVFQAINDSKTPWEIPGWGR